MKLDVLQEMSQRDPYGSKKYSLKEEISAYILQLRKQRLSKYHIHLWVIDYLDELSFLKTKVPKNLYKNKC